MSVQQPAQRVPDALRYRSAGATQTRGNDMAFLFSHKAASTFFAEATGLKAASNALIKPISLDKAIDFRASFHAADPLASPRGGSLTDRANTFGAGRFNFQAAAASAVARYPLLCCFDSLHPCRVSGGARQVRCDVRQLVARSHGESGQHAEAESAEAPPPPFQSHACASRASCSFAHG